MKTVAKCSVKKSVFTCSTVYNCCVSSKRVARLMREHGFNAPRTRRKRRRTTAQAHGFAVCPNLPRRDFSAQRPGCKRICGIACLRTPEDWLYLTAAIGLFDRKAVSRVFSRYMDVDKTGASAL